MTTIPQCLILGSSWYTVNFSLFIFSIYSFQYVEYHEVHVLTMVEIKYQEVEENLKEMGVEHLYTTPPVKLRGKIDCYWSPSELLMLKAIIEEKSWTSLFWRTDQLHTQQQGVAQLNCCWNKSFSKKTPEAICVDKEELEATDQRVRDGDAQRKQSNTDCGQMFTCQRKRGEGRRCCPVGEKDENQLILVISNNVIGAGFQVNPKKFWCYVTSCKLEDNGIPPLRYGNNLCTSDKSKAEALNSYFYSVFTQEKLPIPTKPTSPYNLISDIDISAHGVHKQLLQLNPRKPCGPDEIAAHVLKELAPSIAPWLSSIFQQSYDTGTVPSDLVRWLKARIYTEPTKAPNFAWL